MSQFKWTSNGYDVLCGWDRPLQYFFLVIEKEGADQRFEDSDTVYSNLSDKEAKEGKMGGGLTLTQLVDRLHRFHIEIPLNLEADLRQDREVQRMNHVQVYDAADFG